MALAPLLVYSLTKTEENTAVTEEKGWVVTEPLYERNNQQMGGYGSVVRRNEGRLWIMPKREREESGAWDRSCRCAECRCRGKEMEDRYCLYEGSRAADG